MKCCQASLRILIGLESWCSSTPKNLQQQINLQISVNGQGLKLTNFIFVNKFKKAIPQCVWQCSIEPCQLSSSMSALDGFHHLAPSFVAKNPNGLTLMDHTILYNFLLLGIQTAYAFWTKLNKLFHSGSGSAALSHASSAHQCVHLMGCLRPGTSWNWLR